jgi:hypothetical protein
MFSLRLRPEIFSREHTSTRDMEAKEKNNVPGTELDGTEKFSRI